LYRHLLEIHDRASLREQADWCGMVGTGGTADIGRPTAGDDIPPSSEYAVGTHEFADPFVCRIEGKWLLRSHGTATTADYTVLLEPVSSRRDVLKRYLSDHHTELVALLVAELDDEIAGAVY
jgi:hypothetical protein